eukprot:1158343-Pelagomonas_calceolata.AAC.5
MYANGVWGGHIHLDKPARHNLRVHVHGSRVHCKQAHEVAEEREAKGTLALRQEGTHKCSHPT